MQSRLLSARQAAIELAELGIKEATARRRAAKAFAARDPGVIRVASGWLATEAWWREQFREPPRRGRPKKHPEKKHPSFGLAQKGL
jgi:hypothetical protein